MVLICICDKHATTVSVDQKLYLKSNVLCSALKIHTLQPESSCYTNIEKNWEEARQNFLLQAGTYFTKCIQEKWKCYISEQIHFLNIALKTTLEAHARALVSLRCSALQKASGYLYKYSLQNKNRNFQRKP